MDPRSYQAGLAAATTIVDHPGFSPSKMVVHGTFNSDLEHQTPEESWQNFRFKFSVPRIDSNPDPTVDQRAQQLKVEAQAWMPDNVRGLIIRAYDNRFHRGKWYKISVFGVWFFSDDGFLVGLNRGMAKRSPEQLIQAIVGTPFGKND